LEKDDNSIKELIKLIKKLRSPDGCPWDRKQKKEDIGKYILEEAYEVFDSLEEKAPKPWRKNWVTCYSNIIPGPKSAKMPVYFL